MEKSSYLEVAIAAAKKAEEAVMDYYLNQDGYGMKDDRSVVTKADKDAEEIIKQTILSQFPDHGFLGEEGGAINQSSAYTWVIDPIDGTRNFTRKIPLFSILIALMKGDELVVGVSNACARGELLYAEKGKGAYCGDTRIHVSSISSLDQAMTSYGGLDHFDDDGYADSIIRLSHLVSREGARGIGNIYSYHLLAMGNIDIMVETSNKLWDIAAPALIVQEAGGTVTDIRGEPISLNSVGVIATNGLLHNEVLTLFTK